MHKSKMKFIIFWFNLNQNILGIADYMTYIMFQPDVAVMCSSGGIMTIIFDSFLASYPLVCAKLKIRYIIGVDVIKPTSRFKLESLRRIVLEL